MCHFRQCLPWERTSAIAGTDVRIFGSEGEAIADADNRPAGAGVEVIRIVTGVQRAPAGGPVATK
jgi:hypothetical protein